MKITRKGVDPRKRGWVGACVTCGATAEAEEHEMTNIVISPLHNNDRICWMTCPECGANADLQGMFFYPRAGWTAQR